MCAHICEKLFCCVVALYQLCTCTLTFELCHIVLLMTIGIAFFNMGIDWEHCYMFLRMTARGAYCDMGIRRANALS